MAEIIKAWLVGGALATATLALVDYHFAGLAQRAVERLFGDGSHERAEQPAETGRHVAGEGEGFTLQVDAAVPFFEAPVGVEAPKITVAGAHRQFFAVRLGWVFHLSD